MVCIIKTTLFLLKTILDFVDGLCKQCPKLKCFYLYQFIDTGEIEAISIKSLTLFEEKDKFHNLESIHMYYYECRESSSFLESINQKLKYVTNYLTAKCPKIKKIVTYLSSSPKVTVGGEVNNKLSLSIRSTPYVNFYLQNSCLVEQKVTDDFDDEEDDDDSNN